MNDSQKLLILLELGKLLGTERNLSKIIDVLAKVSRDVTESDRCSIYIYNKRRKILWTKVAQELGSVIKLPLGKGIAGDVALNKKTQIIYDVYNDDRFNKMIDEETGYKTEQMLVMPILDKSKNTLGVIQVLNKKSGKFNQEDIDSLTLVANYSSAVIENASLHKHLENRIISEIKKNKEKDTIIFEQARVSAMADMINAIAHNWRQPLNAIGLIVSDLRDAYDFNELNEFYLDESVEQVSKLLNNLSKTIDDFRSFFKPRHLKEFFYIDTVLEDTISVLKAQYSENGIDLNLECKAPKIEYSGYPRELKQVIFNILKNSKDTILEKRKSSENIKKKYKVDITFLKIERLTIVIVDNAGGVDEEIIDRIFEPYFSTKEQGKGIGMGLYTSKMIIENQMKGEIKAENISIDSEKGLKTTIYL